MKSRNLLLVSVGVLAVGCAGANGTPDSSNDSGADIATAMDASGSDVPIDNGAPDVVVAFDAAGDGGQGGGAYTLNMPTVTVAVGQETTQCVEIPLGNTAAELIRHIHVSLAPGSHHLIVYRSTAAAAQTTPVPCAPLGGIQTGSAPLFIAQATESDLVVPDGVGISIGANQMIRLEEHFLNITSAPIAGTGAVTVETVAAASGVIPADLFFWGSRNISIPAHSAGAADYFNTVRSGVNVFGLTAHEHHFGTLTTIEQTTGATVTGTELYRNTNWAEPPLRQYAPPVTFDGTTGLHLHCDYMNTSAATVTFGESAVTDEMCFFWAYYYPSHGFDIQIH